MAPPVSLSTALRVMNEMGRVVDALVADPAVKEKIQAELAAINVRLRRKQPPGSE